GIGCWCHTSHTGNIRPHRQPGYRPPTPTTFSGGHHAQVLPRRKPFLPFEIPSTD
ncbi:hypothetical protein FIBSPDRAFT_861778, partial [Athelia psychrophila]